jgi:Rieske Fe-S protein
MGEQANVSRRGLLCGIALLAVGLLPEAALAAVPAVGIKQVGKKLQLDLKKNAALAKVGGVVEIGLSDGSTIAVVRTAAGNKGLVAMNLACTHQGVPVAQVGNKFVCPAHGSQFGLDGKVIQGPAQQGLYKYPLTATATTATIG